MGKHRRIKASSLMQYLAADDRRQRAVTDERSQLNQEMGLLSDGVLYDANVLYPSTRRDLLFRRFS